MKRVLSFIIMLALFTSICSTALADTGCRYIALGDSITHGTRLENIETERYSSLLSYSDKWNISTENLGVDGLKSGELLSALLFTERNDEETLKNIRYNYGYWSMNRFEQIYSADVITVGIGSNNLLGPFIAKMCEVIGVDSNSPTLEKDISDVFSAALAKGISGASTILGYISKMETALKSPEFAATIDSGIADFQSDFSKIIDLIHNMNPQAKIVATDFYNPFYGVKLPKTVAAFLGSGSDSNYFDIGSFSENYISRMNDIIHTHHKNNPSLYTLVSVHDDFDKLGMTNVSLEAYSFDPHPNKAGHQKIAEDIFAAVKNIPAVESFRPGDIDGNHRYSASDALSVLKTAVRLNSVTKDDLPQYDCDNDGRISAVDALIVLINSVK